MVPRNPEQEARAERAEIVERGKGAREITLASKNPGHHSKTATSHSSGIPHERDGVMGKDVKKLLKKGGRNKRT